MILSKSGRLNTEQTLICYKIYYINPFINDVKFKTFLYRYMHLNDVIINNSYHIFYSSFIRGLRPNILKTNSTRRFINCKKYF